MSRVLVVEDHEDTCRVLTKLLTAAGHEAVCALNGRAALAALVDGLPDVIVLDLMMPEMDGVEFLRNLREYVRWAFIPVILVTGAGDNSLLLQRARHYGVFRVFAKASFELPELLAAIDDAAAAGAAAHQPPG
jgi:CheY-like chemotaxis protein